MTRRIFVNLPVKDLDRSVDFFSRLGFEFDKRFTDDKATCMIVNDQASVMLLAQDYFTTFTDRQVCDPGSVEALFAISTPSREAVDEFVDTAMAGGGQHAGDPQDHGFMYQRSFADPDGHWWEVFWMDEATLPQQ